MPAAANLTRREAERRAELLEVSAYQVDLDLTSGPETFRSRTTVRFTCRLPGEQSFIDLVAPSVLEVRLNGEALDVDHVVGGDRIQLPDLTAENELVVVADCAYMHTGEGLHRFVDPVDEQVYLYSQFEVADARRVFCCFEQPDLKASFALSVLAPRHWKVLSASPTPDPQPGPEGSDAARWVFEATPPLSTYVVSVVAGPYEGRTSQLTSRDGRSVPLGVYCRASMVRHLDAEEILEVTRAGFAYFEELFDLPYPFAKYDQVFVPEFNAGAMENAGCVTLTDDYVFRSKPAEATVERRALTVLHELAHMWFGDLVTMRWWDDLWLNESFAEYVSTRCQAEVTRWDSAWTTFLSAEKAWAYRQDQLSSTHPIVAEIRDLADVEVNFDGITYAKGASVLKQLVHWVGRDAFDEGIRGYFRRHAWRNTTLADLLGELARTSGQDLGRWAGQWLEQAGVNTVRAEVTEDAQHLITSAALVQEAPVNHPVLRPHRIGIGGYDVGTDDAGAAVLRRSWNVEADVDGERTELRALIGRRRPDLLLLNDADLTYTKIRLDERSLATATTRLGRLRGLPARHAGLGGDLGHDQGRRARPRGVRRPGARPAHLGERAERPADAAGPTGHHVERVPPAGAGRGGAGRRSRPAGPAPAGGRARQRRPAPAGPGPGPGRPPRRRARPARGPARRNGAVAGPGRRHRPALDAADRPGRRRPSRSGPDRRRAGP